MFSEASSHFLKSPIKIFNAYIDKIEEAIDQNKTFEEMEPYFKVIQNSINEEEKYINNMFDYNKILLTQPKKNEIEVVRYITHYLNQFQKKHQDFDYEIIGSQDHIYTETDPKLLEKIVTIILENAYLSDNHKIKIVHICIIEHLDYIKINFKDYGSGDNFTNRSSIFRPYIRKDTIEHISGIGIGLMKAQKAAELINAEVILLDFSQDGSTFQLKINRRIYNPLI